MTIQKIKDDIFFIGVRHWDRRLFDELIPLPDGTSYNAYLIKGSDKTALIDTADPSMEKNFFSQLSRAGADKIDYIISNHAEQDHSGLIPHILEKFPDAKVVTNAKNVVFLKDLLLIPDNRFIVIDDKDELNLGNKTLQFILTPWVHWPETMVTYLKEDKVLFTCDFFGSHLATSDLYTDEETIHEPAKRYYAEIMMPFRSIIKNNLRKIENFKFDIIAPSHGPIYNNPDFIINAYKDWVSDNVKKEILIPYVSMHGSTKAIVEYLVDYLLNKGVTVTPINLTVADIGQLAIKLVDAAAIILATPTVLTGLHPSAAYALYLINALRPKTKYISIIGSYGWGGKALEVATSMMSNLEAEIIDPFLIKGYPKKEDFTKIEELANKIIEKLNTL